MPRSVQIYFPPQDFEWHRQALEMLADALITDDEAGQRGAKVSVFIRMLTTAYIRDGQATIAALETVKRIALGSADRRATMPQKTILDLYASRCETDWEQESLLELANAYCDPHSTLDTADLAEQLERALDLPAGALASYFVTED